MPPDDQAPLLLAPEQAARALSISRTSLYRLLQDGELPSFHIGRNRKIALDDLKAFIDSKKVEEE
jgi:excisionase family DNA binding protein